MVRVAPDSNDVLVLPLNDGPVHHLNKGTETNADWTFYGGTVSKAAGILDMETDFNAIYIPGSNITGTRSGTGGANDVLVSPNISLSGWVFLRKYPPSYGELFNKQYFINGWSSPFLTFGFQMLNTVDGRCDLYITTDGTLRVISSSFAYPLPLGKWFHLGGTWDGTNLIMYMNGNVYASGTFAGTISYPSAGTRGQWYAGGILSTTNQEAPAIIQDIRLANITRPQSYFANIAHQGLFVP